MGEGNDDHRLVRGPDHIPEPVRAPAPPPPPSSGPAPVGGNGPGGIPEPPRRGFTVGLLAGVALGALAANVIRTMLVRKSK